MKSEIKKIMGRGSPVMSGAAAGRAGRAIGPWRDLSCVSLFPFFLRNENLVNTTATVEIRAELGWPNV